MKFHENRSSGSRVVVYEQTNGWTELSKLICVFLEYANEAKRDIAHTSQKTRFSLLRMTILFTRFFLNNQCSLCESYGTAIYTL